MAEIELVYSNQPKKWIPFLTLTLSQREAHELKILLGMTNSVVLNDVWEKVSTVIGLNDDGIYGYIDLSDFGIEKAMDGIYGRESR